MTVKEAMMKVCDDRATFPEGWNTQVAEGIRRSGGECYERRQKRVWLLTIMTPYNGEGDTITLWRSRERAVAAMKEDIRESLAHLGYAEDEVVRDDDEHAHLSNKIEWAVTQEDLNA